jgi:cytochrome c biogenesis protein CcmG/thiol:disulfide interchange protein DsbE
MTIAHADPDPVERHPVDPGARLRRAALTVGVGGLVTLVLLAALAELVARDGAGPRTGVDVANYRAIAEPDGRRAPSFSLPRLGGNGDVSVPQPPNEVIVLNFWASWCTPCRTEATDLQAVWRRYRQRDVRFVGVDYGDDEAAARAFVDEFGLTYGSVVDGAGTLAAEYEVIGLPTTFVISPDGTIVFRFTGRIDAAVLTRAVEDVLDGPASGAGSS